MWTAVAPDGQFYDWGSSGRSPWLWCNCAVCGPGGAKGSVENTTVAMMQGEGVEYQWVFGAPVVYHGGGAKLGTKGDPGRFGTTYLREVMERVCEGECRYNFETGIWSNDQGHEYKNGKRVE